MQADPLTLQFNESIIEQVALAWLEHAVYGQSAAPFGYPTGCCAMLRERLLWRGGHPRRVA